LLQHFKGWIIETTSKAFDPNLATFMDFRFDQSRGATFAYVLPFSETKAMVEYTLFTEIILANHEYEKELKKYIEDFLNIKEYKITEKEFGVIPMTTRSFDFYKNSIYNIGTVGGQTKASSGYTFQFIQKQSDLILRSLIDNKPLRRIVSASKRFLFYDKVLLNVLQNKKVTGKEIFSTMFKKNKPEQVLKFLDNESSLTEELKIISTLPTLPFLKAAIRQL
jgi:lycopene beta-cyclase